MKAWPWAHFPKYVLKKVHPPMGMEQIQKTMAFIVSSVVTARMSIIT